MRNRWLVAALFGVLVLFAYAITAGPGGAWGADIDAELEYTVDFVPGAQYDPLIPKPGALLGFPVGQRSATPAQIERCIKAWDKASPRTRLVEYARTFEGRPLHYMIITSPENLSRIDEIKEEVGKLADPRGLSQSEGERLVKELPAVAWLAYSIHGDESSGADASLAVIYHLAASTDTKVTSLLEDLVVLVDPMMNPDGRGRFVKQVSEARGALPNVDDQSLLHSQDWPGGRGNHYLFDMNRDWTWGTQPETRGRVRAAGAWHPQLFVDAHEMGSQNTYLFSPSRDPINPNLPKAPYKWSARFAQDQAAAFDRYGWTYYHGEWADEWYIAYSTSWSWLRGAVGTLYEQAGITEDGVRHPDGSLITYRESVHHQFVSSISNIKSLHANATEIKRDYLATRRAAVSGTGPYANRTFAVLPSDNGGRVRQFLDLMELQGFEVYEAGKEISVSSAVDQLGRTVRRATLPRGTILIPNRQPEANLLAAMLEFDPRMPDETLLLERQEILRTGSTRMYDMTGWNVTMLFGLESLTIPTGLPESAVRLESAESGGIERLQPKEAVVGYVLNGADDASVAAAARLMERGVRVRVADRAFRFDGVSHPRGSILVTRADNPDFAGEVVATLEKVARDLSLQPIPASSGLGEGDLPDIGGRHFRRLYTPRIAVLARGNVSTTDFGAIWFMLDRRLGIRSSQIDETSLSYLDLRRYNVLVIPDSWRGDLSESALRKIKQWVQAGGTLIAVGGSAGAIATEESGLSSVRTLPETLGDLDKYELQVMKEWLARADTAPDTDEVWSHTTGPDLKFPWDTADEEERPDEEVLKKRDEWATLFMPGGAVIASRVDEKHWLTFGSDDSLPVLFGEDAILMSAAGIDAPVRLGYMTPKGGGKNAGSAGASNAATFGEERVGWAALPAGHEMRLRMSGLLWPEAAQRIANAAYVTRERSGRGQVILFAAAPARRAMTLGTARILTNAMIYGPGLGTRPAIKP